MNQENMNQENMKKEQYFWDNLAEVYGSMSANSDAYQRIYALMNDALTSNMKVLEVGTASGFVAREVAGKTKEVHAIDFSEKMIATAKGLNSDHNIHFSVQDCTDLAFDDNSFDVVIIVNVLHIMKNPEDCLKESKRVLKSGGLLIAPTFLWKEMTLFGKFQKFLMNRQKFPIYSEWSSEEYINFLNQQGFSCLKHEIIKNSFNICYAECKVEA